MDNVFEELQKYIDKRVEEAVDAKIEELKAYLLNPASMTLTTPIRCWSNKMGAWFRMHNFCS